MALLYTLGQGRGRWCRRKGGGWPLGLYVLPAAANADYCLISIYGT